MKIEKISFGAIATKLSRAEMKKIMAGSGGGPNDNVKACSGKSEGSSCYYSGRAGICLKGTWTSLYCNVG